MLAVMIWFALAGLSAAGLVWMLIDEGHIVPGRRARARIAVPPPPPSGGTDAATP